MKKKWILQQTEESFLAKEDLLETDVMILLWFSG